MKSFVLAATLLLACFSTSARAELVFWVGVDTVYVFHGTPAEYRQMMDSLDLNDPLLLRNQPVPGNTPGSIARNVRLLIAGNAGGYEFDPSFRAWRAQFVGAPVPVEPVPIIEVPAKGVPPLRPQSPTAFPPEPPDVLAKPQSPAPPTTPIDPPRSLPPGEGLRGRVIGLLATDSARNTDAFLQRLGSPTGGMAYALRTATLLGAASLLLQNIVGLQLRQSILERQLNDEVFHDAFNQWRSKTSLKCVDGKVTERYNDPYFTSKSAQQYIDFGLSLLREALGESAVQALAEAQTKAQDEWDQAREALNEAIAELEAREKALVDAWIRNHREGRIPWLPELVAKKEERRALQAKATALDRAARGAALTYFVASFAAESQAVPFVSYVTITYEPSPFGTAQITSWRYLVHTYKRDGQWRRDVLLQESLKGAREELGAFLARKEREHGTLTVDDPRGQLPVEDAAVPGMSLEGKKPGDACGTTAEPPRTSPPTPSVPDPTLPEEMADAVDHLWP